MALRFDWKSYKEKKGPSFSIKFDNNNSKCLIKYSYSVILKCCCTRSFFLLGLLGYYELPSYRACINWKFLRYTKSSNLQISPGNEFSNLQRIHWPEKKMESKAAKYFLTWISIEKIGSELNNLTVNFNLVWIIDNAYYICIYECNSRYFSKHFIDNIVLSN